LNLCFILRTSEPLLHLYFDHHVAIKSYKLARNRNVKKGVIKG
jgi:hypothetical protein